MRKRKKQSNIRRIENPQVQCYTYGKHSHYSWKCFFKNEGKAKLAEVDEGVGSQLCYFQQKMSQKEETTHGILIMEPAIT